MTFDQLNGIREANMMPPCLAVVPRPIPPASTSPPEGSSMIPVRHILSLVVLFLSLPLLGCAQAGAPDKAAERAAYLEKIAKAEAIYHNACKNIAVPKVYKTVHDVNGILLMKVRPRATDREYSDPNWPGAAFAREAGGDSYIKLFLGYEPRSWAKNPFHYSIVVTLTLSTIRRIPPTSLATAGSMS
jgi:hypothetical protein